MTGTTRPTISALATMSMLVVSLTSNGIFFSGFRIRVICDSVCAQHQTQAHWYNLRQENTADKRAHPLEHVCGRNVHLGHDHDHWQVQCEADADVLLRMTQYTCRISHPEHSYTPMRPGDSGERTFVMRDTPMLAPTITIA